jgi:hypothetical protein
LPFTLAHTAAALPFLRQPVMPVVPLALVAGTMAPDLPYFVPVRPFSGGWFASLLSGVASHEFTQILTVGLPLALALAGYLAFVAKPLRWSLPEAWVPDRSALLLRPPSRVHLVLWTFHSLLIGLLTHLLWDSFTHSTGWFVQHLPALSLAPVAGMPIYRIIQHLSTLAGLSVLVLWYVKRRQASTTYERIEVHRARKARAILLALILLVPAASAAFLGLGVAPVIEDAGSAEVFLQVMILRGGTALLAALAIYSLAWHTGSLVRNLHTGATTRT